MYNIKDLQVKYYKLSELSVLFAVHNGRHCRRRPVWFFLERGQVHIRETVYIRSSACVRVSSRSCEYVCTSTDGPLGKMGWGRGGGGENADTRSLDDFSPAYIIATAAVGNHLRNEGGCSHTRTLNTII